MESIVYIYALADPKTDEIRYVGKSIDPSKRLEDHIKTSYNDHRRKSNWIQSLMRNDLRPKLIILEEVPEEFWQDAERNWIAHYRVKYDLTNHTSGGDGVQNPSIESRQRLSASWKRLWADDSFRERMLIAFRSPNRCEKISKALSGRKHSAEHVAKLPQNSPGWHHTEEAKQKIRQAMLGNKYSLGVIPSEETRRKISIASRGNKSRTGQSPSREERLKKSRAAIGVCKSDEHRRKISEGIKRNWASRSVPEGWGSWERIDWPSFDWIEDQLKSHTIKELAKILGVKSGTLSGKIYRERKKRRQQNGLLD